jgi:hypothetical protein
MKIAIFASLLLSACAHTDAVTQPAALLTGQHMPICLFVCTQTASIIDNDGKGAVHGDISNAVSVKKGPM